MTLDMWMILQIQQQLCLRLEIYNLWFGQSRAALELRRMLHLAVKGWLLQRPSACRNSWTVENFKISGQHSFASLWWKLVPVCNMCALHWAVPQMVYQVGTDSALAGSPCTAALAIPHGESILPSSSKAFAFVLLELSPFPDNCEWAAWATRTRLFLLLIFAMGLKAVRRLLTPLDTGSKWKRQWLSMSGWKRLHRLSETCIQERISDKLFPEKKKASSGMMHGAAAIVFRCALFHSRERALMDMSRTMRSAMFHPQPFCQAPARKAVRARAVEEDRSSSSASTWCT